MYQECGAYQLCSLCALSRGVRTFALGGARGPPGAEAEAACACRPRARSGAGIAAQAAVRPTRVRVGHVVEHVAARAAGRPAGAADRARPEAARVQVRLALLDGYRVPGARAGRRRVRLIVGRVAAGSLLLAERVMHEPRVSGGNAAPREGVAIVIEDACGDGPAGRRPRLGVVT